MEANIYRAMSCIKIERQAHNKMFLNGVIKGIIVVGAFCVDWLNPDLVVIEFDGQTMNLEMAVYVVLLAGFTYYAVKVIAKLKNIVTSKSSGETEKGDAITNNTEQIE